MELHCAIRVIKATEKGNTAAAAAAYISCDKTVGYDGKVNDYTNKPGFVAGNILLPDGAPQRWREDPSTIWAEQDYLDYEKSTRRGPKSELYRAGDIGLPWDLSDEQCMEVMDEIGELLCQKGMVVQWAIHDIVDNGVRNRHGHIMMSMRSCDAEGFGKKNRAWNHYNGGLNIPEYIRPKVAEIINRELQAIGSDLKVEHESFVERGVDKIPTKHMGPAAAALERNRYDSNGNITRAAIKTEKGNRNRYIEWLNQIHADNMRQVETHTGSGRLDDLIAAARVQQGGSEVFKDWDALFALIRDTRRCRSAMTNELGKLSKIISAYEEENEGYLRWSGCDPGSEEQRMTIQAMQNELRIKIKEMDATEALLLDSKELYKAHNKVVYTSKKASWDQYVINRDKRGIAYCERRILSIQNYMDYLMSSISLLDIIFKTQDYRDYCEIMADLKRQEKELWEQLARQKAEFKQAKKDIKTHRRETKEAMREEKKAKRQYEKQL